MITRNNGILQMNQNYGYKMLTSTIKLFDVDGIKRNIHYLDTNGDNCVNDASRLPLVIVGGTAQTISTFAPHIRQLSKSRRVIFPELRCQGQETQLLPTYGNMARHTEDFRLFLEALNVPKCDFVGFSFGGRVGVTVAALYPDFISRLSVTGVPLVRPDSGENILSQWRDLLSNGSYFECGQSFLINGYSAEFINKNKDKLPSYIEMINKSNNMTNLHSLITLSHPSNDNDAHSLQSCATRVKCPTQVIASMQDIISGYGAVKALADAIPNSQFASMGECGHLSLFENPGLWRKHVTDFLDGVTR